MASLKAAIPAHNYSPRVLRASDPPSIPSSGLHGSLEGSNEKLGELLEVLAAIRSRLSGEGEAGTSLAPSNNSIENLASAIGERLTDAVGQARSIAQTLGV